MIAKGGNADPWRSNMNTTRKIARGRNGNRNDKAGADDFFPTPIDTLLSVMLVDGNADTQEALRGQMAVKMPGWRLNAYTHGNQALQATLTSPPRLLLVEQTLPDGCGIQWTRSFKRQFPNVPVVILATEGCPRKLFQALCAGVCGYVVKNSGWSKKILPLLPKAMDRRFTLCEQGERLMPLAFAILEEGDRWGLTPREREVMLWLCRNKDEKEISTGLGLAIGTVHVHMKHAYKKLGVHSRQQAVEKYLPMIAGGGGRRTLVLTRWLRQVQSTPISTL